MNLRSIRRILGIIIALTLVGLAYMSDIHTYISLASLKTHKVLLDHYVQQHYALAVCCFIAAYTLAAICSFPISLMTITGGFLFGIIPGIILSNLSATAGAVIACALFRSTFGTALRNRYHAKLATFHKELEHNGFWYLLTLRLIAIIPFSLVNIVVSMTSISLITLAWTTSLGTIPSMIVYTFAGQQLDSIDSLYDILSVELVGAFLLLGLFTLIPIAIRRMRNKTLQTSP